MPAFRAFVLGLDPEEVRRVVESVALPAELHSLPPPLSLMLGLSRERTLNRRRTPSVRRMARRFLLFGFWSVVTVLFFGTIVSFLFGLALDVRVFLLIALVALGIGGLMATGWYWTRVVNGDRDTSDLGALAEAAPWDVALLAPEAGLAAIAIALGVIFVAFVLFAVWIPLLFLVLNVVTLGELWRRYRLVVVEAPGDRSDRIAWAGRELLRRGGVLSRGWDAHLDLADIGKAQRQRNVHGRIERQLILVGMASLFLTAIILVRGYFPPEAWDPFIYATAAFTAIVLGILVVLLFRARAARVAAV